MKNKILVIALILAMVIAFSACGGGSGSPDSQQENSSSEMMGESTDLISCDKGEIKFIGFQKADPKLVDEENAYVFVYEYTNHQDDPSQCQNTFWIQYFQNGSELTSNITYHSSAQEQYDLVQAFYNDALKDGTVKFGQIVIPNDESAVTVMAKEQNNQDHYETIEVDLGGKVSGGNDDSSDSASTGAVSYADAVQIVMDDIKENGTNDSNGERSLFFPLNSLSSYDENLYIYEEDNGFKVELVRTGKVNKNYEFTIVEYRYGLIFDKGNEFDKKFKSSYTVDGSVQGTATSTGTLHTENFDPERPVTIDDFDDPVGLHDNYNCVGKDTLEKQIGNDYAKTLSYFASYLKAYHSGMSLGDFGVTKYEADTNYILKEQAGE